MSRLLLFIAIAVIGLSSCSVYRSGQTRTPDDVYYSPAREGAAYVETEQKREGSYRGGDDYSYDDRWLRMRVRDRYRWSAFDDYDWNYSSYYNPYGGSYYNSFNPYWNYGIGFNNYWNAMYRWNSFYNPYCGGIIIVNPKGNQPAYTAVRNFTLDRYTNTNYNNTNRPLGATKAGLRYSSPTYNNGNTRTTNSLGSSIRRVFSNGNSGSSGGGRETYYNTGSSNDRPNRTYTPSSSSSSSSRTYTPSSSSSSSSSSGSSGGSSGGGGGGVSRPSRGGN
ncbi:MAG: hypothetical protein J7621_16675 [Niastella sp.]|nr:hypothetical protein [Niastella sp.]